MADKIATRQAYGEALIELVEKNDKVVVLDADLANATQFCCRELVRQKPPPCRSR